MKKLGWPLIRLMFVIGIALIIGQLLEVTGWISKLAKIAGPLFRFSNLGMYCSATFSAAFVSGVSSNTMLYQYYTDKKISRTQLILCNLVNQFPVYILHVSTTLFMIIPLTGIAGVIYIGITFIAALARTGLLLLYGHWYLNKIQDSETMQYHISQPSSKPTLHSMILEIKTQFPIRMTNMMVYVIPIYVIVFIFNEMDMFLWLNTWLMTYISNKFIPVESLSIVVLSFASEFTSGFAAAGAMRHAGILTIKQTVLALVIGNIIAFPIRTLRHQLPRYLGIFTPKIGTQLLLLGQFFRILSIIMITLLYLAIPEF